MKNQDKRKKDNMERGKWRGMEESSEERKERRR